MIEQSMARKTAGSLMGATLDPLPAASADPCPDGTQGHRAPGHRDPGQGGTILSGPASELYLRLWNRQDAGTPVTTIAGDRADRLPITDGASIRFNQPIFSPVSSGASSGDGVLVA